MNARITISLTEDGTLEIYINELGRDLLVQELLRLSEGSDHFHLGPKDIGEVELSAIPYTTGEQVLEYGKVLFRPDEWDQKYFPHVFGDGPTK